MSKLDDKKVAAIKGPDAGKSVMRVRDGLADGLWLRVTKHKNTQGVDVPYAFDGGVTFTVANAQTPSVATFSIVRAQAKLESPLLNLAGQGGALLISAIAEVTFFGRDQTGNDVSVTGTISINFADWADPTS